MPASASIVHRLGAGMRALVAQARCIMPLSAGILILGELAPQYAARLRVSPHSPRRSGTTLRLNAGELADAGAEAVLFMRASHLLFDGAGGIAVRLDVAELSPVPHGCGCLALADGSLGSGGEGRAARCADVRIIALSTRVDLAAGRSAV